MLIASCLFKEDGTLLESQIPNIVLGDKESVKLEVSFYEDYDNLKLLDLSNYVVEAIFERPDGKVSPALLLGIDLNNFNKKYLIFGGWLTEVAGISKITVRIKQSGTVKATGFLTFTIQDGNVPADVVITEPQFEALENAINAEEQARIADFQKAQADREAGDKQLDAKIDEVDERLQGNINYETYSRESQDTILSDRIDRHEVKVDELHVEADRVHNSKLDKNFANAEISTLPVSSSDYVVIVSNGNTYRVTLEQLAVLISQKTDYFKGQFSSLEHLNSLGTDGFQGGDYAYVDTEFTDSEGNTYYQFVTYVWDVEDARWEETKSSQYATQADYTALVQSLLDGTFNLGSIKANSSPEESPLLTSLHVNQRDYSLPSVELEFSDEHIEGAYDMNSFKINGVIWNVPKNVKTVELSTERVENAPELGSFTTEEGSWNMPRGGGNGDKLTTIAEFTGVDADNNMILFDNLQFETDTLYFAIIENYVVPIYWDSVSDSINADFSANFGGTLYFMHLFYDGTNAPNSLKLTGQALDGSTFPYISRLSSAKICKL